MPSTPSSCLSSTNPLPPRVAGISYGVFFQDTIGATQSINVPPNYLMWMSNNVPPAQNVGSAGDWYIMTTSDSMVVYQKSNVWTAYTTLTGGIPVSLTGIYTTLTSLQNQINSIVSGSGTVTSVSSGGLANFATVGVSNPSSTPALSFSLVAPSVGYVWAGGIPTGGPNYYSLSTVMDSNYGSTRGSIAYRGASGWTTLPPGLSGYVLASQGSGNDPHWASVSGVGTVTSITAGTGLTGGTITTSGTIGVSTTQNITTLSNLTSNGFVGVTGSVGTLVTIGQTGSGIVVCQTGPSLNGTPTAPTAGRAPRRPRSARSAPARRTRARGARCRWPPAPTRSRSPW